MTHDSPTPPSPMTATVEPAGDRRRLEHGAHARRDAAADERGDRRIDAVGERDRGRLGHDGRLGHRRDAAIGQDRLAGRAGPPPAEQCRRPVGQAVPERRGVGAGPRPAGPARPADPARHQPRQRDRLADPQRRTPGPTASTTPAPSWPMAIGVGRGPLAVADVQVGVADAGRQDPHPDLAGPRLGQLERLDRRRPRRSPRGRPRARACSRLALAAPLDEPDRRVRHVRRPPGRRVDDRRRAVGRDVRTRHAGLDGLAGDRDRDRARDRAQRRRSAGRARRSRAARRSRRRPASRAASRNIRSVMARVSATIAPRPDAREDERVVGLADLVAHAVERRPPRTASPVATIARPPAPGEDVGRRRLGRATSGSTAAARSDGRPVRRVRPSRR